MQVRAILKKCGSLIKAIPGFMWRDVIPILKPVSTAGWVAYPVKSFMAWVLETPEGENVLDNPVAAGIVTTSVIVTFSLNIITKYYNLKRKHGQKPKKEIHLGTNPLKWFVYGVFFTNSTLFYPWYCFNSGFLSAEGWWQIFSSKPVDDALWKLIFFNILGAIISYPAVKSSLTSNRNLIMYDYLPDILDGTCFKTYSKSGVIFTVLSLGVGWPLTFSSNESTASTLSLNLLRHLSSKLEMGNDVSEAYSYINTLAVTFNNLIMTPIAITDMINTLTTVNPDEKAYQDKVPECHDIRKPVIGFFCIYDSAGNALGVVAAMSKKWFANNPRDPYTAICAAGGFVILLCVAGTNVKAVLVERAARYRERILPLGDASSPQVALLTDDSEKLDKRPAPAMSSENSSGANLTTASEDVKNFIEAPKTPPQPIAPLSPRVYTSPGTMRHTLYAPLADNPTSSEEKNMPPAEKSNERELQPKSRSCFDSCTLQ